MPLKSVVATFPSPAHQDSVYADLARRIEGGEPVESISESMGLALPEIQRITAQQDFRYYLENYRNRVYKDLDQRNLNKYAYLAKIEKRIGENAERVLERILDLALNAEHEMTRLKACMYWLEMANIGRLLQSKEANPINPALVMQLNQFFEEKVARDIHRAKEKVMSDKVVEIGRDDHAETVER